MGVEPMGGNVAPVDELGLEESSNLGPALTP
jgi:hypothetical protein